VSEEVEVLHDRRTSGREDELVNLNGDDFFGFNFLGVLNGDVDVE
jgi:hypothetical protein